MRISRMTARFIPLVLAAVFYFLANSPVSAQTPVGRWKTIDDETGQPKSIIAIWEYNGKLYGKIEDLINPDSPNPLCDKCEGELHNKPIIGMTMMGNLSRDGDKWSDGWILDPKKGTTYRCQIWLEGPNQLKVRGFVAFFYRTQTWYRMP